MVNCQNHRRERVALADRRFDPWEERAGWEELARRADEGNRGKGERGKPDCAALVAAAAPFGLHFAPSPFTLFPCSPAPPQVLSKKRREATMTRLLFPV